MFPTLHSASGKPPIPDAVPDALCTASKIMSFLKLIWPFPDVAWPTPVWCVRKKVFPNASSGAVSIASRIPFFPTFVMLTSFLTSGMLRFLIVRSHDKNRASYPRSHSKDKTSHTKTHNKCEALHHIRYKDRHSLSFQTLSNLMHSPKYIISSHHSSS